MRSLDSLTFSAGQIFGRVHVHEAPRSAERIARSIDDVHVEHIDHVLHALFALVPARECGFEAGILAIDTAERFEPFAREWNDRVEGHEKGWFDAIPRAARPHGR